MHTSFLSYLILCFAIFAFLHDHEDLSEEYAVANIALADTVKIIYAESIERIIQDDLPVQILEGSVRLRQDSTRLNADKVTRFLTLDEILLEGNVLIIQEKDSIFSDKVRYDTELKIGYAQGNVRLTDGEVEVFAPSATHYVDEKRTLFNQDVRLIDSLTVLTSLGGEYFSEPKRAEFYGDVVLEEDQTYLQSDSVTYYRETEISLGYGNVFIERIENQNQDSVTSISRTFLFGDYVYNDNREGYSLIEGHAFLFQVEEDSLGFLRDSLFIQSNRLEAIQQDSLDRLVAVDSVRIWQDNFSALADSAVYDRITEVEVESQAEMVEEENRLFGSPIAWYNEYQLSGDSLLATAKNDAIDSLFAAQNAFVAFMDTTTKKINQLQGESLVGLFRQDSLESLTIGPQAELIFFQKPDEGDVFGSKISGDEIQLYFEGNELSQLKAYSGIEQAYYAGSLIPEPFILSGFMWLIDRKPTKIRMLERIPAMHRIEERLAIEKVAVSDTSAPKGN